MQKTKVKPAASPQLQRTLIGHPLAAAIRERAPRPVSAWIRRTLADALGDPELAKMRPVGRPPWKQPPCS